MRHRYREPYPALRAGRGGRRRRQHRRRGGARPVAQRRPGHPGPPRAASSSRGSSTGSSRTSRTASRRDRSPPASTPRCRLPPRGRDRARDPGRARGAAGPGGLRADRLPAPDAEFERRCGIEVDPETPDPRFDPETCESNVPGLYVAGTLQAGRRTDRIFIENSRDHGPKIVAHLKPRLAPVLA